jgi:hypothetical protein
MSGGSTKFEPLNRVSGRSKRSVAELLDRADTFESRVVEASCPSLFLVARIDDLGGMSGRIADFDEPSIPAPTDEEREKSDVVQRGWPGELLAAACRTLNLWHGTCDIELMV